MVGNLIGEEGSRASLSSVWLSLIHPSIHSFVSVTRAQVDGPKLANMLQNGKTPLLPPKQLQEIGYTIVAYPLALLRCVRRRLLDSE